MAYQIIGIAKQKGGSVGASGRHNDRTRDTPNADPERLHLNRVLVGDERTVREQVDEIIAAHGGKPRSNAVEAVELLLTASPEFFAVSDPVEYQARLDSFIEVAVAFLADPRACGICAKATLHMDERTPHIQAHKVPIDPNGKLNCKYFLGGRQKMKEMHNLFAEYTRPLGLERGREGSRARHQTVKQFYASIEKEVELKLDEKAVPNPPRMLLTAEAMSKYKQQVYAAVLGQVKEPLQTLQHQAMLTKDERAHRVEAERRAAERVAAVEQAARAQIATQQRTAAEQYANLHRSATALLGENKDLRAANDQLRTERNTLNDQLMTEQFRRNHFEHQAAELGARLTDIPLVEVMTHLGYRAHTDNRTMPATHIYLDTQGEVASTIIGQQSFDHLGNTIARNALDQVCRTRWRAGHTTFTQQQGLDWLKAEFGAARATAAWLVHQEQAQTLPSYERVRLSPTPERLALTQPRLEPTRTRPGSTRGGR
jgi:hypothetical protein